MAPCFSQGHTARTADMNPCPVLFFDTFSWPCCVLSQLCPLLVCCRKYSGSHLLCPQHLSSFPPSVVSEFPDGASLAPESILLSGRSGPLWLLLRPRLCSSLALTWSPAPGVGGQGGRAVPSLSTLCSGHHILLPEELDLCHIQSALYLSTLHEVLH